MIRPAKITDSDSVWEIFRQVIKSGDTYVFDPTTPKAQLQQHWFADYMETFVLEKDNKILGTYILKPNQPDLGAHVANASYMVHPAAHGRGLGKELCQHSISRAREVGYSSMQFNIVVSANKAAIALWKKFDFEIIGTTPDGFNHQKLGLVDTHIMFRHL